MNFYVKGAQRMFLKFRKQHPPSLLFTPLHQPNPTQIYFFDSGKYSFKCQLLATDGLSACILWLHNSHQPIEWHTVLHIIKTRQEFLALHTLSSWKILMHTVRLFLQLFLIHIVLLHKQKICTNCVCALFCYSLFVVILWRFGTTVNIVP